MKMGPAPLEIYGKSLFCPNLMGNKKKSCSDIKINLRSPLGDLSLTGFTLLEVMVSALLIMVGLGALGVMVVAGKRFLRQAEYRSQAMSLATSKIAEFSARGYAVLKDTTVSNQTGSYNWTASVVTRNATNTRTIPYKDIEVVVSSQEEDGSGGLDTKHIRLTNIVPYPTAHTDLKKIANGSGDKVPFANQSTSSISPNYRTIGESVDNPLMLNGTRLKFEVPKDIAVSYGVAVGMNSTDNGTEIDPFDTIYSACFYSNSTTTPIAYGVETRTPIKTQLSFNNAVVIKNVPPGNDNKIQIKWYYDRPSQNVTTGEYYTSGYANTQITLRKAELSILATEAEAE